MTSTVSTQTPPKDAGAFPAMMQMITGYWVSQCIYVAAKLGIADLLASGPKPVATLAQEAGADEDNLYRILRALAGLGIFEETGDKTFRQTPSSALLQSDSPQSLVGMALMMGEEHYQAWGHLLESVRTGTMAFESMYGMPVFEYFQQNRQAGETFNKAMTGFATNVHRAMVSAYDFSGFRKIVDVGGGHGALIQSILTQNPHLQGVLFDLPHVVEGAKEAQAKLGERLELAGGDFFKSVAPGGDVYILSTVIHDWSDDLANRILRNIHTAMPEQATLLLVENVVEADNRPSPAKFLDINMMVMTQGGRERSREEFRKLYADAGFELTRIIPTNSGICIVEGRKI